MKRTIGILAGLVIVGAGACGLLIERGLPPVAEAPLEQRAPEVAETDEKVLRACNILCCRSSRAEDSTCGHAVNYTGFNSGEPISCNCEVRTGKGDELLTMRWVVILLGAK